MPIMLNNKYYTWYSNICQRAFSRSITGYTEKHHILPKSIFPEVAKDPTNLATLTAREHFLCHWLLTKIFVGDSKRKMCYAFSRMIEPGNQYQSRYLPKSTVYAKLRESLAKQLTGKANGNKWYTNGTANLLLAISSTIPDGYYLGRSFSESHKEKLSDRAKERVWSEEQKINRSTAYKGRLGHSQTEVTKKKISDSRANQTATDKTRAKMSASKLGKKRGPYKSRPKSPTDTN